jgi:peptidoglycan/LPS O-acetylase OafA/YrhL
VPAFWSLGVEEKFYLLIPLLVLALGRLRSTRGTVAILLTLWALPIAARAIAAAGDGLPILDGAGWRPIATGSYCLYLTHMMVMPVAEGIGYLYPWVGTGTVTRSWLNFLPWYLLLSVTTAYALHRVVEQPALRWRDRQLASRSRRATAAVSPVPS